MFQGIPAVWDSAVLSEMLSGCVGDPSCVESEGVLPAVLSRLSLVRWMHGPPERVVDGSDPCRVHDPQDAGSDSRNLHALIKI